jgi:quinol monooxygenase YgiN
MNAPTLRVVARITARPDTLDEVKAILLAMVAPTHGEDGCIVYELLQNISDPTDFTFVEEWASERALDAHLAAPHIAGVQPRLLQLIAKPNDVRRYRPASRSQLLH